MKQKLSKAAKQASLKLIKELRKNDPSLKPVKKAPKKAKRTTLKKSVPPSKSKTRKANRVAPPTKRKPVPQPKVDTKKFLDELQEIKTALPGKLFVKLNLKQKEQPIAMVEHNFAINPIEGVEFIECDSIYPKHDGLAIFAPNAKAVNQVVDLLKEMNIKWVKPSNFKLAKTVLS